MKKFKILRISLLAGFILTIAFSISGFAKTCDEIRGDVLRLHVLANSDSEEDQQLKLKVRDALLTAGKNIFDGSVTKENAEEKIEKEKEKLIETAEKVIRENGFDYPVEITVTDEFFTTRTYENVTLPAGKYKAVRVLIGESAGKNWWCVMFPPLCARSIIYNNSSLSKLFIFPSPPKSRPTHLPDSLVASFSSNFPLTIMSGLNTY